MKLWHKIFITSIQYLPAFAIIPLGTVIISWNANPEPDVMGYRIYYGNTSGNYAKKLDVGKVTEYTLSNLSENKSYFFAVTAYDTAGNESNFSQEVSIALTNQDPPGPAPSPSVSYNFPNPFNPEKESTHLRYVLEQPGEVSIAIYDMSNNLVRTVLKRAVKLAGEHIEDMWDGRNDQGQRVASGIYFCKIQIGGISQFVKIAVSN